VPNDVILGVQGDANMMITGPNGSGKSTNMKAIALNVLLAQTFGIAAAEQACLTPFNKICTYINVQENIQDGMSTFMAEAQRLEEIDHAITSITPNSRCLTLIDEGMRGTVASEGVKRLCDVCKRICMVPQSICIIATHFEEPTKLQEETHGHWINYYVEIDEPTPGNFVRLYTLKRGVNSAWFTNDQSRKRFVDWLVKTTTK
jgi:DNA mismatch repair protein MutS